MTVDFVEPGSLSLNLTDCDRGSGVMILAVRSGGQAAKHVELRRGLILTEVGGISLRGMSLEQVTAVISEHPQRPLRVVFSDTPWSS